MTKSRAAVSMLIALLAVVAVVGLPRLAGARPADTADPAVLEIVGRVDAERALSDLRRLSGEAPVCVGAECRTLTNRVTGSEDLAWTMDYVLQEVADLGYEVTEDPWKNGRWFDRNVILRKPGVITPTEEVYFVAHVDGVASCPGGRCPGADDNGSGAVAALEMARAFADAEFARTVVLFFSTGEEQNTLGVSAWLRENAPEALAPIVALVNADMIGWDGDDDNVIELYYGEHEPSLQLAYRMRDIIAVYEPVLRPKIDEGCG